MIRRHAAKAGLKTCATTACGVGAVIVALTSCHAAPKPATGPALAAHPAAPARPASPSVSQLLIDIDAILADPALEHSYWGVLINSLARSETLYERNARKLLVPASNMKIVTLAAAAEKLGWDFTYETKLLAAGTIAGGRLDGDLVVVGSGDPSIGIADGMAGRLFAGWAERLKAAGIQTIAGRIIGNDNAFDDEGLGFGWSWDDLVDDYAAGVSALQFNENAVRVTVVPGVAVGDWASVSVVPAVSGVVVDSALRTTAAGAPANVDAHRLPGSSRLELRGSVPLDSAPLTRAASVDNPTLFFATALRNALIEHGIDVRGPAMDVDDAEAPAPTNAREILTYRSPPLSELAVRLMKISQNLYAETLLKTLGASSGTATFAAGRAAVRAALDTWGIHAGDLIQRDGSGLSRYDFVSASALVTILTHVDRDATLRGPFEAALPIAGRDGTLANRLKGTAADGNARAKTGSMTNVRALSGYVTTADGEPLVFSILANNFETSADVITKAADAIVIKLAGFRR